MSRAVVVCVSVGPAGRGGLGRMVGGLGGPGSWGPLVMRKAGPGRRGSLLERLLWSLGGQVGWGRRPQEWDHHGGRCWRRIRDRALRLGAAEWVVRRRGSCFLHRWSLEG